jgi:lipopolysaccharide/colanic/teichoic acid biosynthesis glycosyltransferase
MIDKLMSIALLTLLIPLIITIILIQFSIYGPKILFYQERSGLDGIVFRLIKFRTMIDKRDIFGKQLPDKQRLTSFGKILRFLSLDELPNMINVVKGDLSFVGPRPFPTSYFNLMNAEQKKRYSVRPGITGLAQIMGRNNLSWKSKISYDLKYIENINFFGDLIILFKTFRYLFTSKRNEDLGDQSIDDFIPDFDQ